VPETFAQLAEAMRPYPNVIAHNMALSSRAGTARMAVVGTSTGNHLVKPGAKATNANAQIVDVVSETGATFAERHGISRISFLKIDAEGHEFDVLLGFVGLFPQIDFVQVEASMNPYNKTHVPFRIMEDFLRHQDFLLFRFYDQAFEAGRGGRPVLRRTNPVFIKASLVDLPRAR
jgi:FkbM family methyltransferase